MLGENMYNMKISSWNISFLPTAKPYINVLLTELDSDILFISEHRLFKNELYKLNDINDDYCVISKASSDLETKFQSVKFGHCGVAMFYKKSLANNIRTIQCESDRICVLEISNVVNSKSLFVIGVYLPQQGCKISSFMHHVDILTDTIEQCKLEGEICLIGDFNCHFSKEMGKRFYGKSNRNAKMLYEVLSACSMFIIDSEHDLCNGPCYTFFVEGIGKSYIDHCAVTPGLREYVNNCMILEDCIENTSDHLPIIVSMKVSISECVMLPCQRKRIK